MFSFHILTPFTDEMALNLKALLHSSERGIISIFPVFPDFVDTSYESVWLSLATPSQLPYYFLSTITSVLCSH